MDPKNPQKRRGSNRRAAVYAHPRKRDPLHRHKALLFSDEGVSLQSTSTAISPSGITHRLSILTNRGVLGNYAQKCLSRGRGTGGARADPHKGIGRFYGGHPAPRLDPEASRPAELRKEGTALLSSVAGADQ